MTKTEKVMPVIGKLMLLVLVLGGVGGAAYYLTGVYHKFDFERFIYAIVLVCALFIGTAHIILFIFRKILEKEQSSLAKRRKRKLEKTRNVVNYITPFVLVAMGYHFWVKGWVVAIIIVAILLLDRLNDLLRKNK